jgi:signal transduction histidine kinase
VQRLEQQGRALRKLELPETAMARFFAVVERAMEVQRSVSLSSAVETRHLNRRLRSALAGCSGVERAAFALADLGPVAEEIAGELKQIAGGKDLVPLAGYLRELAFLVRASNTIRTAIQTIRRIVGALKRYSRLDEAPVEDVDVHAGIEDTLVILAHQLKSSGKGINLKRSYGNIPCIAAYAGELNQVWTNLIFNAVQAVEGSGEILIETAVEGGNIRVAIQDDGPGVQPEVMSKIFEPFFTTKGKGEGTGLGLSISHRIVEKHGGSIRVESAPGRTRFEVRLPIKGPAGPRPSAPARDRQPERPGAAAQARGATGSPFGSVNRGEPKVPSAPPRGQGRD